MGYRGDRIGIGRASAARVGVRVRASARVRCDRYMRVKISARIRARRASQSAVAHPRALRSARARADDRGSLRHASIRFIQCVVARARRHTHTLNLVLTTPIHPASPRLCFFASHAQGAAALSLAKPARAAYGDSANVFGKVSNPTGAYLAAIRCDVDLVRARTGV